MLSHLFVLATGLSGPVSDPADWEKLAGLQQGSLDSFADLNEVIREVRLAEPRPDLDAGELYKRTKGERGALEFLIARLETKRLPSFKELPVQVLSEVQATLILDALKLAPTSLTIAIRDARLTELADRGLVSNHPVTAQQRAAQTAALQVTGALGMVNGVDDLFTIMAWPAGAPGSPAAETIFEEALFHSLSSQAVGYTRLLEIWDHKQASLATAALRAVGRAGSPQGLAFVEDVIRWLPDLTSAAAAQVRILGPSHEAQQNESLSKLLLDGLPFADPGSSAQICLALGGLRNETAIPSLIELLTYESITNIGSQLTSAEQRVRESALWALHQISGQRFANDAQVWRLWLEDERRWLAEESGYWLARVHSENPAVAAEAIRQLGKRRMGRDDLASAIAKVLEDSSPAVKQIACEALSTLDSPVVLPKLLEILDGSSPAVKASAWSSIYKIGRHPVGTPRAVVIGFLAL